MEQPESPVSRLTDQLIAEILDRAVDRLAELAPGISILVPEPRSARTAMTDISTAGWCEIGTLRDARGRFWYRVLWHPESGAGRLLRERPRARTDTLGAIVPRRRA